MLLCDGWGTKQRRGGARREAEESEGWTEGGEGMDGGRERREGRTEEWKGEGEGKRRRGGQGREIGRAHV